MDDLWANYPTGCHEASWISIPGRYGHEHKSEGHRDHIMTMQPHCPVLRRYCSGCGIEFERILSRTLSGMPDSPVGSSQEVGVSQPIILLAFNLLHLSVSPLRILCLAANMKTQLEFNLTMVVKESFTPFWKVLPFKIPTEQKEEKPIRFQKRLIRTSNLN